MKKEQGGFFNDNSENKLIRRYERMRREGTSRFFDVSEFEDIINTYLDADELEKAEQTIRLALRQHPTSFTIRLKKAELLVKLDEDEKALKMLETLIRLDPENYEVYLLRGLAYTHLGRTKKAIHDFNIAISMDTGMEGDIAYQAATELELSRQYHLALKYMQKAREFNPYDTVILFEIGYLLSRIGDERQAIIVYKEYLEEEPFDEVGWNNLGEEYLKQNRHKEALEAFEFALAIRENLPDSLYNKAYTLMQAGRWQEAVPVFQSYLTGSPDDVLAMLNLGNCYRETGEYGRALTWYKVAMEERPEDPEPYFLTAQIYKLKNKWDKAETFCRKAIDMDHEITDYWYELFLITRETKEPVERLDIIDTITTLEPENPAYWIDYIDLLLETGASRQIQVVMKQAFKRLPDHVDLNYLMSIILFRRGENDEGTAYLSRGLSQDFSRHAWFMEKYPELRDVPEVIQLIQHFKSKHHEL